MMSQVLLIYEMVPEKTQLYFLSPSQEDLEKLKWCHGKYGNSDEDPQGLLNEWLPEYLDDKDPIFDSDNNRVNDIRITGDIEIIITGFIL